MKKGGWRWRPPEGGLVPITAYESDTKARPTGSGHTRCNRERTTLHQQRFLNTGGAKTESATLEGSS